MSGRVEIYYAGTGLVLGGYANVLITILTEPSTMESLREVRKYVERFRKRWPDVNCGLTVLTTSSMELNLRKEVRDESTAIARDNP